MRKKYPSDITKEQFAQIRAILESARKKTAPRKVDLYEGLFSAAKMERLKNTAIDMYAVRVRIEQPPKLRLCSGVQF